MKRIVLQHFSITARLEEKMEVLSTKWITSSKSYSPTIIKLFFKCKQSGNKRQKSLLETTIVANKSKTLMPQKLFCFLSYERPYFQKTKHSPQKAFFIIFSRNIVTIYRNYCNVIGYRTRYLSGDSVCRV